MGAGHPAPTTASPQALGNTLEPVTRCFHEPVSRLGHLLLLLRGIVEGPLIDPQDLVEQADGPVGGTDPLLQLGHGQLPRVRLRREGRDLTM
jgi:hypothetical protein